MVKIISLMFAAASAALVCCSPAKVKGGLIPDHRYIALYDLPGGNKIDSVIDDTINEDCVTAAVEVIDKGFTRGVASGALADTVGRRGWIKLEYPGIYSSVYSDTLFLRVSPDRNAAKESSIETYRGDLFEIKDRQRRVAVYRHVRGRRA